MALPRNSFVLAALEGVRSCVSFVRVTLDAWWNGGLTVRRRRGRGLAQTMEEAARRPQPLAAFPELQRLGRYEPWLTNPLLRAQCMWQDVGSNGQRFRFFILSDGRGGALGILTGNDDPAYMRLYANFGLAALDGTLWAGEIRRGPVCRVQVLGGIDPESRRTWSLVIVQRQRRYELQITRGGLIPETRDYRSLEEAMLSAEAWLTDFHLQDGVGPEATSSASPTVAPRLM